MAFGTGGPRSHDVKLSPERQIAKMRESMRSGGGGSGAYTEARPPVETPVSPKSVPTPEEIDREIGKAITLELTPDANDKDMEELLAILESKGLRAVLKELDRINSPHLEDDLHRFLVQYKLEGHHIHGLEDDEELTRSLDYILLEVAIPYVETTAAEKDKPQGLKEIFSTMEQLLQSLTPRVSIPSPFFFKDWQKRKPIHREYFVLELAVSHGREDAVFYLAVPRHKRDSTEKQIFSIYPRARIAEQKDDYNIFNQFGAVAITEGNYTIARGNGFSMKIGEDFNSDPLNIVLSSFSKIAEEGEGAAIQIVVGGAGAYHTGKLKAAYADIQKGMGAIHAFEKHRLIIEDPWYKRWPPEIQKAISEAMFSPEGGEGKHKDKPVDSIAAEAVAKKLKSEIAGVNLRIVASARTEARAKSILSDIQESFNQFSDPRGNYISFRAPKTPKAKKKLIREFIFRVFDIGFERTKFPPLIEEPFKPRCMRMSLAEVAAMYHFVIPGGTTSREAKMSRAKLAPAPPHLPKEGILIGRNRYANTDTDIYFTPEDRLRHFYTIGQTGTGKTSFLKNMIIQDIQNGEGLCFIDPHGVDILEILSCIPKERYDDVIYFDPAYTARPMGLNMLEFDPRYPEQKTFVVDEMFKIFKKLYGDVPEAFGPIFEQYFRNATLLVLEDPESGSTLLDISRVLSDDDFRALKLSRCRNPVVKHFWEDIAENVRGEGDLRNIVPYITSKFDIFIANEIMRPIVGQQHSAFNFKDVMDKKKILLVNLSKGRLGDLNANLLGLVLVGKILMSALARTDYLYQNPPPFYLYMDEFQNVTTDTIATILSEARKYRLSLTMAHQFIKQLEEKIKNAVFGNVGSMAVFRVGAEDAEFLKTQFEPTFGVSDMLHIENRHAYVKLLADGKPVQPFSIETIQFSPGDSANIEILKQLSYQRYGRARDAVDEEIRQKYGSMHGA
ncbi:MAG TPA: type IV secretory system conjugative DNA transfer family protein [Candidatus Paceibacterota bacterium]